jgi:hypothetical protein
MILIHLTKNTLNNIRKPVFLSLVDLFFIREKKNQTGMVFILFPYNSLYLIKLKK